ncbi:matrix metalloproteinase-2-like [Gigantopelta aegis]|uniref:matrix metalloproteinase-2-like n=1 Tax=Gigantopelta aegis TaxID=1735272 RepID=UPI001B88CDBF|nr:matrix metalloproteinase-2-like [Gigantopelta aegis]
MESRIPEVVDMAESADVYDVGIGVGDDDDGVSRCCCGSGSSRCSDFASRKCTSSSLSSSSSSSTTFQRWKSLPQSFMILFLSLVLFLGYSQAFPDPDRHLKEMYHKSVEYLSKFGYLEGPSRETGNLMSQTDLSDAIKTLQKMGGIPQTGVVDSRTIQLMHRPRCGNQDSPEIFRKTRRGRRKKRYTIAPSKWDTQNLTFRILNYTPDMPMRDIRTVIYDAFKVWSDATMLTFSEVMYGNADIMIQFASRYHQDGYPFDGKGMILAHAFFPGEGKGGDTHFDDDENWTYNSTDGVDLFMVAAHEFGHALGLAHSSEPGALMYPWYQGFQKKFALPRDDILGIQALYGHRDIEFPDEPTVSIIPTLLPKDNPDGHQPPKVDDTDNPLDPCAHSFDAITVIRTEVFLFIGRWFWRLDSRNIVRDPVHINKFWYGLPKDIDHVDAVFELPTDGKIVFFVGDKYWVLNANHLVAGFPEAGRPITEFGIPPDVKKIDTVFVWGFNKRTYLVSGDMYWKLDVNNTYVEYDYPRDMSIWRGIPVPVDAAFQYWDGKTYFFKGRQYWEFYDLKMKKRRGYPKSTARDWLKCSGAHTNYTVYNEAHAGKANQYGAGGCNSLMNVPHTTGLILATLVLLNLEIF